MGLTKWKSLTSGTVLGKPAKGLIADLPASCFQYKIAEDVYVDFGGGGIVVTENLNDRWTIHIYDHYIPPLPASPPPTDEEKLAYHNEREAALLFRQMVTLDLWVMALCADMGGVSLLSMFTWWVNYATIETTRFAGRDMPVTTLPADIDGAQVLIDVADASQFPDTGEAYIGATDSSGNYKGLLERFGYVAKAQNPNGTWTLTCYVPTQRADGTWFNRSLRGLLGRATAAHSKDAKVMEAPPIYMGADDAIPIPGGGSDYTANTGIILFEWLSPIYDMSLPAGACMEFAGHYLGRRDLGLNLDIVQTRVCGGDTFAALYMPETGYWWLAEAGTEGVRVQCVQDMRAAGVVASDEAVAPNSGRPFADVQRAFDGWTVSRSSALQPILLRQPNSLRPMLVYHKAAGSYAEQAIAGGEWTYHVQLTTKTIVASCFDEGGTLCALAVSSKKGEANRSWIIRRAVGPIDGQEFYGPGDGDEIEALLQPADPTQDLAPFPLVARTHRLEMRASGNGSLVTADGKYYMTTDGGETWIG